MNPREWLNQNSALTTVATVVLLICALGFAMCHLTKSSFSGTALSKSYYYDLVEGKVFGGPLLNVLPPIDGPNGPISDGDQQKKAGLRAYIFDCGGCSTDFEGMTLQEVEAAGARIGYLELFKQKALDAYSKFVASQNDENPRYQDINQIWVVIEGGKRMAQVPSKPGTYPKLTKAGSAKGTGYKKAAIALCPDGNLPQNCMPPQ